MTVLPVNLNQVNKKEETSIVLGCGANAQQAYHLDICFSCHYLSLSDRQQLVLPPFSNIRDHHLSSGHPISPDDFSILSSCSSSFELLLRESLLISKLKPSLNANLSSVPLTLYN